MAVLLGALALSVAALSIVVLADHVIKADLRRF